MLRALGSAFCGVTQETGGTTCYGYWGPICYRHWVLRLVIHETGGRDRGYDLLRALGSVSCDITHTRDKGYDLLRALGSVSCDIAHVTRGAICYGHWVRRLVISHTRQGYDFVRAGSGFCDITHETGGTICYGHWVLRLLISHRRQGYDLLWALGSMSCGLIHETGGTICYKHCVLRPAISYTRQEVRFVTSIPFCVL